MRLLAEPYALASCPHLWPERCVGVGWVGAGRLGVGHPAARQQHAEGEPPDRVRQHDQLFERTALGAHPHQAIPPCDIKGSVTQLDENVIRNQKDLGVGFLPYINLGQYSAAVIHQAPRSTAR